MHPLGCRLSDQETCVTAFNLEIFGGQTENFPIKSFRYISSIDSRVGAKFGENRTLESCRKVVSFGQKNRGFAGDVRSPPILLPLGRSRSKFPERCRLWTCACAPNLVGIGCGLPERFPKD